MNNKIEIVTGASTGIGKEIARHFIERKSNVVMNSSNEENLRKAYNEFGSPSNVIYLAGDISKQETGHIKL